MSNLHLLCINGAITQPLRMESYQTQINMDESGRMTSAKLGPSTLRVEINANLILDKRQAHRFLRFNPCNTGEILLG